ncbi:outer membrane beta-barrel protein [Persicobacter sp. CCB-QB2]|uniref:outer membrane beta-barrel protein n=1 Tax=Persicobacter sp. CCB-QB2 TaxID=1561025 RepID=UPI0012F8167E|nr:outer membrane beta-barrel protein [Persicobacter sp. CCB-QB2]
MKGIFALIFTTFLSFTALAQENQTEKWVKLGINYSHDIRFTEKGVFGFLVGYQWSEKSLVQVTGTNFSTTEVEPGHTLGGFVLDADYHRFFIKTGLVRPYGIIGGNMMAIKEKIEGGQHSFDGSAVDFGFNLGIGIDFRIANRFSIAPEVKISAADHTGSFIRTGATASIFF